MDWIFIMDTAIATLCASIISISGMLVVNWLGNRKGYKDIDAKIGKLDNTTLSGQHKEIEMFIDHKIGNLPNITLSGFIDQKIGFLQNTTLSGQNQAIIKEVNSIREDFIKAKNAEDVKRQQLTEDQARIDQSIAALSAFSKMMIELQNQNAELRQELKELKQENQQLKQRIMEIVQQEDPAQIFDNSLTMS